jgi:hypothetical protein
MLPDVLFAYVGGVFADVFEEQPFLQAMSFVRLSRMRTGAVEWGLYRDGETANRFVEFFVVPSWEEHLRQHRERLTGADRQFEEQAEALSDPPSQTTHLLAAEVPD